MLSASEENQGGLSESTQSLDSRSIPVSGRIVRASSGIPRGRDLNINTNYTFSKMVELWGYTDPYANVMQQGLYFNDRPHWFKFTAVYELPFGQGKK